MDILSDSPQAEVARQQSSPQHLPQPPDQGLQQLQHGVQHGVQQDHDRPPELPPRPLNLLSLSPRHPPAPHAPAYTSHSVSQTPAGNTSGLHTCRRSPWYSVLTQKYVILTIISGTLSIVLGSLFITIYFIVRNTTSSLHYFETLPTYIPGIAMTCTGLLVMLFSKTSNRKSCLVKFCGCFCLLSALLCVVVTVTTTVVHMNRLQTLRECVYQASTKTCTCFAGMMDHRSIDHDATLRYVFAAAPNCEVIHGTIYSCLRAMFGLSVIGILVSIFSCMLVYQILSHEKKKKYLAELNSRCRGLYQRPGLGQYSSCQYPWTINNRLCSGNLYTPTPELSISTISTAVSATREPVEPGREVGSSVGGGAGGWSWLPWSRKHSSQASSSGGTATSGLVHSQSDSLAPARAPARPGGVRPPHWRYSHSDAIYGFRPPPSTASLTNYSARLDLTNLTNIDSLSNLLWGPPPPYSHPPSTSGGSVDTAAVSPSVLQTNSTTESCSASPQRSQSRLSRTTKSGILIENTGDTSSAARTGDSPIHYDDTVDSAMHIYEKLRRSRSGSLPSRRVKKNRKPPTSSSTSSTTNNNLSALNLSRAEELRTAQDLEEIKRALLALQQNSLGLLNNIQCQNSGNLVRTRQELPLPGKTVLGGQRKGRGVYSVSEEQLGRAGGKFSLSSGGGRKTISTTNLIASGTESDNSYGALSSVSASSRASSSLSSRDQTREQVSTINSINSNIIQTANKMMSGQQSNQAGKLPLSLTGLLSPRHLPSLPPSLPPTLPPARMYPSTFSPAPPPPVKSKSGLVYLRQDQNIPENFCDKFRPIQPAAGGGTEVEGQPSVEIKNISSDDIVVTLHSVNV